MNDYEWMDWWKSQGGPMSVESLALRWYEEISAACSGVQIRWARIFGRRWEFLSGNCPEISLDTVRLPINARFGLCLANTEMLDRNELDMLKDSIGQSFARYGY